ncbi:hypothetical protein [Microcoleus sp. FACHB-831]|uniref:hypothetical protein n=1 Tax=Microcoleus sp. FACHB-831 TaxID=2692827 RepID=UPI0035C8A89E
MYNRLGLINCLTFSPAGKTLISSSMDDNTLKIWLTRSRLGSGLTLHQRLRIRDILL